MNPPPLIESIKKLAAIQNQKKIINNWKPQIFTIEKDIPKNGISEEYKEYEYLHEFVLMLDY